MHICDISYSVKISLRISAKQELFGNSKIRKFSSQETPDSTGSRYEHVRLRVPQESYSQAPTAFRVIFEFETWQMIHCLRTAAKIPSFDAMLPLNAVQRNRVNPDFHVYNFFPKSFPIPFIRCQVVFTGTSCTIERFETFSIQAGKNLKIALDSSLQSHLSQRDVRLRPYYLASKRNCGNNARETLYLQISC